MRAESASLSPDVERTHVAVDGAGVCAACCREAQTGSERGTRALSWGPRPSPPDLVLSGSQPNSLDFQFSLLFAFLRKGQGIARGCWPSGQPAHHPTAPQAALARGTAPRSPLLKMVAAPRSGSLRVRAAGWDHGTGGRADRGSGCGPRDSALQPTGPLHWKLVTSQEHGGVLSARVSWGHLDRLGTEPTARRILGCARQTATQPTSSSCSPALSPGPSP